MLRMQVISRFVAGSILTFQQISTTFNKQGVFAGNPQVDRQTTCHKGAVLAILATIFTPLSPMVNEPECSQSETVSPSTDVRAESDHLGMNVEKHVEPHFRERTMLDSP